MFEETAVTFMDYLAVSLIFLVYVVRNYMRHRSMRDRMDSGEVGILILEYKDTLIILWGGAALVMAVWFYGGRTFADMGLTIGYSTPHLIGWVVVAALSLVLAVQVQLIARNPKSAEAVRAAFESDPGVMRILPKTSREYSWFKILSVTAGITEEIIFRGYLIWFFALWLPLWWAALVALAFFVAAHLYQESAKALMKVAAIGAFLTVVYLLSGSLLAAIVLHAVVDLTSGAAVRKALAGVQSQ